MRFSYLPTNRADTRLAFAGIAAFLLLSSSQARSQNAPPQDGGSYEIRGNVIGPAHTPVVGATVKLESAGAPSAKETETNAAGAFAFTGLHSGAYKVSAASSAMRSDPLSVAAAPQDVQTPVVLILQNQAASNHANEPQPAMEFADKPDFTVAGVTDWTAVGGHGSDTILRTSESLARDTAALKPEPTGPAPTQETQRLSQARASESIRLKAEAHEKQGDALAAVREFEQAVQLDPSEQNYFEWGSELLLHRAVWQAQEVFNKGIAAYPKSARMSAALGAALFAGARYDEAALRLCSASSLDPAAAEPYEFMGRIAMVSPTASDCIDQKLAGYVQRQPDNSLANYFYAMALLKQQSQPLDPQVVQQARALLEEAVRTDPKCADGYLQLGILELSERHLDAAAALFTKSVQANPQLGEAHYRLGVTYDRQGRQAEAQKEFKLHDDIEAGEAARIEQQRREVKQFLIVLNAQPGSASHN